MTEWFDRAFGPWYQKLYPHRDLAEAERAIALLDAWLPGEGTILDVGCGPGRHLRLLQARGRHVLGFDRSWDLLRTARAHTPGVLVRGDMRSLPFISGNMAAVLSMFTSFGYFRTRSEHERLLSEFARVVRPGGVLVLDYLNAPAVRADLQAASRRAVGEYTVSESRFIRGGPDGDTVVKELVIEDGTGRERERYAEEVALYDREEVLEMLNRAGWVARVCLGDYDGTAWTTQSPRLLIVAGARDAA